MKHFYEKVQGFMLKSNKVFFDKILQDVKINPVWVEVGSFKGKSTAYCYVELANKFDNFSFTCVDLWEDKKIQQAFEKNLAPIIDDLNVIKSLSWEAAGNFNNNSIDFCYIDAGHTYNDVVQDIAAWYPKIKSGGILGGDDMTKGFPGVGKAVKEFCIKEKLTFTKMGRCWYLIKP